MKNVQEYEAVSRVVKDKNVIGLMVRDVTKRKKEVYMSMDVLCFALCENAFGIKDVKIGNNGKPRGSNGFLLSKLPIVELDEEVNIININIYYNLLYIDLFVVCVGYKG